MTEDTIDLEEDIFDGEDELFQVINLNLDMMLMSKRTIVKMHCETITVFQADFSEAEDVTEKKIVRHIFKVKPYSSCRYRTSKSEIFASLTNMYFMLDYSFPSICTF